MESESEEERRGGGVGGGGGGPAVLTLGPAHGVHDDVVLVNLVLVMLELSPQTEQLLLHELPRVLGLAGAKGGGFEVYTKEIKGREEDTCSLCQRYFKFGL